MDKVYDIRCPECVYTDHVKAWRSVKYEVYPDGEADPIPGLEVPFEDEDDPHGAECPHCGHQSRFRDFLVS